MTRRDQVFNLIARAHAMGGLLTERMIQDRIGCHRCEINEALGKLFSAGLIKSRPWSSTGVVCEQNIPRLHWLSPLGVNEALRRMKRRKAASASATPEQLKMEVGE